MTEHHPPIAVTYGVMYHSLQRKNYLLGQDRKRTLHRTLLQKLLWERIVEKVGDANLYVENCEKPVLTRDERFPANPYDVRICQVTSAASCSHSSLRPPAKRSICSESWDASRPTKRAGTAVHSQPSHLVREQNASCRFPWVITSVKRQTNSCALEHRPVLASKENTLWNTTPSQDNTCSIRAQPSNELDFSLAPKFDSPFSAMGWKQYSSQFTSVSNEDSAKPRVNAKNIGHNPWSTTPKNYHAETPRPPLEPVSSLDFDSKLSVRWSTGDDDDELQPNFDSHHPPRETQGGSIWKPHDVIVEVVARNNNANRIDSWVSVDAWPSSPWTNNVGYSENSRNEFTHDYDVLSDEWNLMSKPVSPIS